MRADKKALGDIFTNVADVITLPELIQSGHLVKPRTFVIDCGLREELKNVRVTANDFDMGAVEKIMDKYAVNERVFAEWQRVAGNRTTVIFCSTVEHASHVTETFRAGGITAEMIEGEMSDRDRTSILKRFDQRKIQVLVNVAVLTEGWDCQHVGCVLLLRPCSHKSTMLQMIGRGLRKVDPERYPGVFKDDCIVLDFGYSLLTYGNLDIEIELTPKKRGAKQWPCPGCATMIPASVSECPICGLEFNKPEAGLQERGSSEREALSEFIMTEVELLEVSPYRWEEFWDGLVTIVNALTAWACCIFYQGRWYAVAGRDGERIQLLTSSSERLLALASSDDFLREHGDSDGAKKSKSWLSMPASQKQLQMLGYDGVMAAFGLNRYRASCELTWKFNEKYIKNRLTAM
jgi:hypothetical protein